MTIQSTVRDPVMSDLHYSGKNLAESGALLCLSRSIGRSRPAGLRGGQRGLDRPCARCARAGLRGPGAQSPTPADHCPVLMLEGTFSHEPPGTRGVRPAGGRYPVMVADRIKQVALLPSGTWAESDGWRFDGIPDGTRLLVSCIPTVNKGAVAAVVGATQAAEALGAEMANLLRALAPGHRDARASGIPTAVVSHGTVSGCTTDHGVPMAGLDS
ncbi:MAG: hypothetical protein IPI02_18590 [Sterolibacteriaceae bacterium]|nr:hypothetical protein [Sterolibacteriaceae bacterium]